MKNIIVFATICATMFLFPFLAAKFVPACAGMAVCIILFFAVNPSLSVLTGVFAGKNFKRAWYQPLVLAISFLAGAWLFFSAREVAFVYYAIVYFVLATVAMFIAFKTTNSSDK